MSEEQAQNKGTKLISCEARVWSHEKRKLMLLQVLSEHELSVKQSQLICQYNCMLGVGSILVEMSCYLACYHHNLHD